MSLVHSTRPLTPQIGFWTSAQDEVEAVRAPPAAAGGWGEVIVSGVEVFELEGALDTDVGLEDAAGEGVDIPVTSSPPKDAGAK
jgi:hypothetical protein